MLNIIFVGPYSRVIGSMGNWVRRVIIEIALNLLFLKTVLEEIHNCYFVAIFTFTEF